MEAILGSDLIYQLQSWTVIFLFIFALGLSVIGTCWVIKKSIQAVWGIFNAIHS